MANWVAAKTKIKTRYPVIYHGKKTIVYCPPPSATHSIHSPVNMEEGTPMKNDCASF